MNEFERLPVLGRDSWPVENDGAMASLAISRIKVLYFYADFFSNVDPIVYRIWQNSCASLSRMLNG